MELCDDFGTDNFGTEDVNESPVIARIGMQSPLTNDWDDFEGQSIEATSAEEVRDTLPDLEAIDSDEETNILESLFAADARDDGTVDWVDMSAPLIGLILVVESNI